MEQRENDQFVHENEERLESRIARRKKLRKTRIAIRIGLCVCAVAFIAGGIIAGKTLAEDNRASNAYSDLRQQTQENNYNISISAESLTVPDETSSADNADTIPQSRPSMDFALLKEINKEIVAWLTCEGTVIDYPVLRADNNDYYLTHLYTKETNRMGSLFVDYRNTGLFTDKNTVIYGHNMKSGAMFNTLSEYKQQDYSTRFPQ